LDSHVRDAAALERFQNFVRRIVVKSIAIMTFAPSLLRCAGKMPWHGDDRLITLPRMRTAIYPGSFDPLTNGHLDLVQRATKLFDHVVVAVARSQSKNPLFTLAERVALVEQAVKKIPNVTVESFDGLLVDYVEKRGGQAVIRGLRAISDFEFEFQLALMNRKLNERVETIFMMPKETYTFLSSRIIKEVAVLGGDISKFVPPHVSEALGKKMGKRGADKG
jgi:pantetheine-phosphate adenylyltransferase